MESSLRRRVAELCPQTSHSIYKVPRRLRDENNKAYEPGMVAIGPYHHGKDNLKEMEKLKLRYFHSLLQRKPELQAEHYVTAIEGVKERARNCYSASISLNEADFIDMLVLDGCFIIGLIGKETCDDQIPFFVLCKLFLYICRSVFPGYVFYNPERSSEEVKHILDLVHSNLYPPHHHKTIPIQASSSNLYIPSAALLKDSNIKFKKKEYNTHSGGTTLFDIEFKEGCSMFTSATMFMPPLLIDDGTESLLRNLIAFEQYLPNHEPARVTDYALLLDCLINSSKDVQILSQDKIIEARLGSDQAVVDFINRLTDKIVHYRNNFIYADAFDRINKHHKKRSSRAMAVLHRDYFNSPWSYLSVSAALLLILLTVAQTFFAARS